MSLEERVASGVGVYSAPTHLVIQKYEVHLDEDEGHSRGRRERQHDIVTFGVLFQLEVLTEFQSGVDHRADAERHGAHSQIEATVVLDRTYRIYVRVSGLRRVAVAAGAARRSRRFQIAHVFLLLCFANLRKFMGKLVNCQSVISLRQRSLSLHLKSVHRLRRSLPREEFR